MEREICSLAEHALQIAGGIFRNIFRFSKHLNILIISNIISLIEDTLRGFLEIAKLFPIYQLHKYLLNIFDIADNPPFTEKKSAK